MTTIPAQRHARTVSILTQFATSASSLALLLQALDEAEARTRKGENWYAVVSNVFTEPLAGRIVRRT